MVRNTENKLRHGPELFDRDWETSKIRLKGPVSFEKTMFKEKYSQYSKEVPLPWVTLGHLFLGKGSNFKIKATLILLLPKSTILIFQ